MKTLKSLRLVAASVLALGVTNAFAVDATFQVNAAVVANCTIVATNLAFGNYDPIGVNAATGGDKDASSTITTTCSKGATSTLSIGDGANNTSGGAARSMKFNDGVADYFLNYDLYRGGYGVGDLWTNLTSTGTGAAVPTTVMGRVPKGQDATGLAVGAYTDSVIATVTF